MYLGDMYHYGNAVLQCMQYEQNQGNWQAFQKVFSFAYTNQFAQETKSHIIYF